MEVFVYNVDKPRETLQQFNDRLQEYCLGNPVIDLSADMVGPSLVVSTTLADDVALGEGGNSLMPYLLEIDGRGVDLEEEVTKALERVRRHHKEEDPRVPFDVEVCVRPDFPARGFFVIKVITGIIEAEDADTK